MKYYSLILIFLGLASFSSYAQKKKPYECGPLLKQKRIEKTFMPLVEKLELSEGDVFADIGASNGVFDVAISMFVKDITFYIQDIDKDCLNQNEFDKVINYYSKQSGLDLKQQNKFVITIGDTKQTNLPDNTFDVIYSNATFHAFEHKRDMMADIYKKLKIGGYLFIRDDIAEDGEVKFCPDEGGRIVDEKEFLEIITGKGFILVEKYDDFDGYPMFKFQKVEVNSQN